MILDMAAHSIKSNWWFNVGGYNFCTHPTGIGLINPFYRWCYNNPIYVGIERSFPDDSKNVSFIDMGLVSGFVDNFSLT